MTWVSDIEKIKPSQTIFIANEFFDSMAIKQFIKINNLWFERYVNIKNKKRPFFFCKKINMKKFEKKINYGISKDQNFIEYSLLSVKYLKKIAKIIKKDNGGLLIIDYGYFEKKMKNTLKAISNHKYKDILKNVGKSDITYNINFYLFKKIIKRFGGLNNIMTTQGDFLVKMGIKKRAEIISKNKNFSEKTDIYFRLKRLIDENHMGNIFKVMFVKKQKNNFKMGF